MGEHSCDYKIVIAVGVLVFTLVNWLTSNLVPAIACQTAQQKWKWRNVATSLVHSAVTAVWVVISFCKAPEMKNDLVRTFTLSSHALVCFSIGYFLYDSFDMLLYHRKRSTYELLIHHFLAILCFAIAVAIEQCVAYVALSLMVEVNSVFLHTRQLFIITNEPKSSTRYKANSFLNIGTFLFFRILLFGWMSRWLIVHWLEIPSSLQYAGSLGLTVIVVMNVVLFCRILFVDLSCYFVQSLEVKEEKKTDVGDELTNGCSYLHSIFEEESIGKRKSCD